MEPSADSFLRRKRRESALRRARAPESTFVSFLALGDGDGTLEGTLEGDRVGVDVGGRDGAGTGCSDGKAVG